MNSHLSSLRRLFARFERGQATKMMTGVLATVADNHVCHTPKGNLYREYNIGMKNIRWPNGETRRVKVTKVFDTAGIGFVVLADNVPFFTL